MSFAASATVTDTLANKNSATQDYIRIYQKYIGAIRGFDCPMYPSCSRYGMKVFQERSFAEAFVLTSDRVLRCGHEHMQYPLTLQPDGFKLLDYPAYAPHPRELEYKRGQPYFAYNAPSSVKADSAHLFIFSLINQGYYQEALLEIQRVEFSASRFSELLFVNKLLCLQALDRHEDAVFAYETKCPPAYKNHPAILYQTARAYYQLTNYPKTLELAEAAFANDPDEQIRRSLLQLTALARARQYQWEEAKGAYQQLALDPAWAATASRNISVLDGAATLKHRSPFVAGVLSIVPGLGYAYAGHKQTALSAFAINGLLAYATYTSVRNENYGMGLLTGIFGLSFYAGNINGSVKSARRYNQRQKDRVIEKLTFTTNP
jgi:putative component of membrane protein insertase Oxa1/YidC/SpoIIIJ protein YidD/tetratricopeptide (TPR) repeat protein